MNLADSAFSGSRALRSAVCLATAMALAFASGSSPSASLFAAAVPVVSRASFLVLLAGSEELVAGIDDGAWNCMSPIFKSEMIWSAVFLRSEDRSGASGLILP